MGGLSLLRVSLFLAFARCFASVSSLVIPNADTPSFYLIAVSLGTSAVRPVLLNTDNGAATLNGGGFPAQYFFYQGKLKATDERSGDPRVRPYINTGFSDTGSCSTYGELGYLQDGYTSTNKCASYDTFGLQSFPENSQLGAKLVFNYAGGFYSCGDDESIWYKKDEAEGPGNCYPVQLFTVPVV